MPSYGDLTTELLRLTSQPAGQDSEKMVKNALNRAYRRVQSKGDNMSGGREFTFTSVASTGRYGMPLYVARIHNIIDQTNDKELTEISAKEYHASYPDDDDDGTPRHYYLFGVFGVQRQPAANGTVTIVSDDNDDNGVVRFTGFNSGSTLISETVTLNGTTSVTTTNSYTTLERIVKQRTTSTTFDGNLTVTDASANTLSVIPYWSDSPDYLWIELEPISDAAITYTVRALMYKPPLIHASDWPEIREDYHDLLLYEAGKEVLGVLGKPDIARAYAGLARKRMGEYLSHNNMRPNLVSTFHDVQAGDNVLPNRPLLPNVDIV